MKKKKRYNFKDDFEMLYLRHDYIEKAGHLDGSLVKKYAGIVYTTAKIMFNRLTNFEKVGFTVEDLIATTNIYMLIYMTLYSIKTNQKELEAVLDKRNVTSLPESEIERIDRNRLISFLRQKIHHCGTLCARKARNITVGRDRRGIFAYTANSVPTSEETILNDYEQYGYRKVTQKEYNAAMEQGGELKDKDGFNIFVIERLNDGIEKEEYRLLMESYRSHEYDSPEAILQQKELENQMIGFRRKTPEQQGKILRKFISKNRDNESLKKEVNLARKMLTKNKTMV